MKIKLDQSEELLAKAISDRLGADVSVVLEYYIQIMESNFEQDIWDIIEQNNLGEEK